jgi:hypothetical protein
VSLSSAYCMARCWDSGNHEEFWKECPNPCIDLSTTEMSCNRVSDLHLLLRHGHCCISALFLTARAGPLRGTAKAQQGAGGNCVEMRSVDAVDTGFIVSRESVLH